ncbi:MAG: hypothetical protein LUC33_03150 [Prevotellaceae bacterium]|nr:hypothetical protein [Prevotellaceae bacterium]
MLEEVNRIDVLKAAYDYLQSTGKARIKGDLAEKMGVDRSQISKAFANDRMVLSDNFLIRLNRAYNHIFSYDWLLSGRGPMLYKDVAPVSEAEGPTIEERLAAIERELSEQGKRLTAVVDALTRNGLRVG